MVGKTVRIPAYADEFMAGIKHGQVKSIKGDVATVKLDPPLRFSSNEGPGLVRKTARYLVADLMPA